MRLSQPSHTLNRKWLQSGGPVEGPAEATVEGPGVVPDVAAEEAPPKTMVKTKLKLVAMVGVVPAMLMGPQTWPAACITSGANPRTFVLSLSHVPGRITLHQDQGATNESQTSLTTKIQVIMIQIYLMTSRVIM